MLSCVSFLAVTFACYLFILMFGIYIRFFVFAGYGCLFTCVCILFDRFIDRWFFFFFKQKTAYEMRISDWSSDVCSSDLALRTGRRVPGDGRDPGRDQVA